MLTTLNKKLSQFLNQERMIVFGGYAVHAILNFLLIKLLTSYFGPQSYGEIALYISVSGIINQFVFVPTTQWIQRYFSYYKSIGQTEDYYYFINRIFKFIFMTLAVLGCVSFFFPLALTLFYGFVFGAVTILIYHYTAARNRILTAWIQNLEILLRLLFSYLIINHIASVSPLKIMLGYTIATALIFGAFYIFIFKKEKLSYAESVQQDIFKTFKTICAPYVGFAVLALITLQMDKWILFYTSGVREVGLYTTLYQIANAPIVLIFTIVSQYSVPLLFDIFENSKQESAQKEAHDFYKKVLAFFTISSVIVCIAYYVLSDHFILFFSDVKFLEVADYLPLLGLSFVFFYLAHALTSIADLYKKPKSMFFPRTAYTALFGLFVVVGAQLLGYKGVVWAHLGSSIIYFILMLRMAKSLRDRV